MTTATATRACAFCGEEILVHAKKCKHCHETLDPAMRKAEEALRASQTGGSGGGGGAAANSTTVVFQGSDSSDTRSGFPHVFHLFMTLITAGVWSVIWLLHYLCRGNTYRR